LAWTLTCGAVAVTLPWSPRDIVDNNDSNLVIFDQDSDEPVYIVPSLNGRQLTITGGLRDSTNTLTETNYLAKLRSMKGKEIDLDSTDGQYDGYWLCKNVTFRRIAEGALRYQYVIILMKGALVEEL